MQMSREALELEDLIQRCFSAPSNIRLPITMEPCMPMYVHIKFAFICMVGTEPKLIMYIRNRLPRPGAVGFEH
jgi:hypothetical protein